ncbi:MAG: Ig-like domain-containing protein, partial [Planctomycetota bacterium]
GGGGGVNPGPTGVITLKALFPGAFIGGGKPSVGVRWPKSGAMRVAQTTPVVLIFSKSMDADTIKNSTFTLTKEGSTTRVSATVAMGAITANRVAVLIPEQPLEDAANYTVNLASGVTDLQGKTVKSEGTDLFGGQSFSFMTANGMRPPEDSFNVGAIYPPPGDDNAAVDTVIQLFFTMPVDADEVEGALTVKAGNRVIPGSVDLVVDPRVVQFTPAQQFAPGTKVTVEVASTLPSLDGTFFLNGPEGQPFSESFTVTSVHAPTSIDLVDNEPIVFGPLTYDGRLTTENMAKFKADVRVPGSTPPADSVTLLCFQQKKGQNTAARGFTQNKGSGKVRFNSDLSEGDQEAAFVDTGSVDPPQPMLMGAFCTRGSTNSPVGPAVMPMVWVKTSKPEITLGPPGDPEAPYDFRTVLSDPAIYGTASEPIISFRAVTDALTDPTTFDAVPLSGLTDVTDENLLFITKPGKLWTKAGGPPDPRFLPWPIDEITFKDAIGNEVEIDKETAGQIHYEGSIGGPLEADTTDALRVRVVKAHNLKPLKNAVVTVSGFQLTQAAPISGSTDKSGEVSFSAIELAPFGTYLTLTVDKSERDPFTLAGFEKPVTPIGISVVLEKTSSVPQRIRVKTQDDIPAEDLAQAFVAAASGAGRPAEDEPSKVMDSRFFVTDLPESTAGSKSFLDVEAGRPQVISNLEHDGIGSYVFRQGPVRVFDQDEVVSFSYADTAVGDLSNTTANTVVLRTDFATAGIVEDPDDIARGRLVGCIPGLCGVLPLSFSPTPLNPGDPTTVTLFAPIPPSLWVEETGGDVAPAHELLMLYGAGLLGGDPPDWLLNDTFRFEVEAAETGSRRLTRQRMELAFNHLIDAPTAEAVDLPLVPVVTQSGLGHPPSIVIDIHNGAVPDVELIDTLFRITVTSASSDRVWTVLLPGEVTTLVAPIVFDLPALNSTPFDVPGNFEIEVEAIEFEAADAFDFNLFTFSDIERRHARLSRSATLSVTTQP